MKRFYFIPLILLFPLMAISQVNVSITGQKTIGGADREYIDDVIQTEDGGFLMELTSRSGMTFDKTDSLIGPADWWIIKLDKNLNIEWQEAIGSEGPDGVISASECEDGYLLAGYTTDSLATGDKTVINYGNTDNWIVKIDTLGNIQWQKVFGGTGVDWLDDMIQVNNRYYILSSSMSDSSGTKSQDSRGGWDGWVYCIDKNGNLIWDKTIGGNKTDRFMNIKRKNNYLYLTGYSWSDISGEKTEAHFGSSDMWIVKMDTGGNIIWDKTIGGHSKDVGFDLVFRNDTLCVMGVSSSQYSGNKASLSFGKLDIWLKYIDDNKKLLFDTVYGGIKYDYGGDILLNQRGNLILVGTSASPVSGNKTKPAWQVPYKDMWVLEISPDGQIIWQKVIGGKNGDSPKRVFQTGNNKYVVFGSSISGATGDKTGFHRGKQDIWIVEIDANVGIRENRPPATRIYPNPGRNFVYIESKQAGTVKIYSSDLQIHDNVKLEKGKNRVDVNHLMRGVYFFQFYDKQGRLQYVKKWIKQ